MAFGYRHHLRCDGAEGEGARTGNDAADERRGGVDTGRHVDPVLVDKIKETRPCAEREGRREIGQADGDVSAETGIASDPFVGWRLAQDEAAGRHEEGVRGVSDHVYHHLCMIQERDVGKKDAQLTPRARSTHAAHFRRCHDLQRHPASHAHVPGARGP